MKSDNIIKKDHEKQKEFDEAFEEWFNSTKVQADLYSGCVSIKGITYEAALQFKDFYEEELENLKQSIRTSHAYLKSYNNNADLVTIATSILYNAKYEFDGK